MNAERPANELPQQQAASFEFVTAPPAAASVQTSSTSGAAQSETPGATTAGIKSETPALPVASGPGNPLNLLDSAADVQVAAAPPEPDAAAEFIDVDSLVTNPGSFQGRDIIVTGSVLRLLERYRLQSNSGQQGLVVEVAGVPTTKRGTFEKAVDGAGLNGLVRVRIRGRVDGDSTTGYRLVASDITLSE